VSIGSVAALKFATEVEKPLPFLVNVSGRYKMNDNQIYRNRPEIGKGLADNVSKRESIHDEMCLIKMGVIYRAILIGE
jgi:hypothetical protein